MKTQLPTATVFNSYPESYYKQCHTSTFCRNSNIFHLGRLTKPVRAILQNHGEQKLHWKYQRARDCFLRTGKSTWWWA